LVVVTGTVPVVTGAVVTGAVVTTAVVTGSVVTGLVVVESVVVGCGVVKPVVTGAVDSVGGEGGRLLRPGPAVSKAHTVPAHRRRHSIAVRRTKRGTYAKVANGPEEAQACLFRRAAYCSS
jgi:hypothetical protein